MKPSSHQLRGLEPLLNRSAASAEGPTVAPEGLTTQSREMEGDFVANSTAMRRLLRRVGCVAGAATPVLIRGETGTGKGLIAQILHNTSGRGRRDLVHINCGALPKHLIESELFGHQKGAFTGADATRRGLFEVADGSTLFLDEIAELDLGSQAKLLQVLDDGDLRRVGGTEQRSVDTRILAATHQDLEAMVREQRFRQDLYFRLKVATLSMPPLRERSEDFDALVRIYLDLAARRHGSQKRFSEPAMARLRRYPWPGNVRELANVVESACLFTSEDIIGVDRLSELTNPNANETVAQPRDLLSLRENERIHVEKVLDATGGKRCHAARVLEIDVKTLRKKIRLFGLDL